jgi:hypothetical protein
MKSMKQLVDYSQIKVNDIILVTLTEYYMRNVYNIRGKMVIDLSMKHTNTKYTILGVIKSIETKNFKYVELDIISTNLPIDAQGIYVHHIIAMNSDSAHYIPSENIKIL